MTFEVKDFFNFTMKYPGKCKQCRIGLEPGAKCYARKMETYGSKPKWVFVCEKCFKKVLKKEADAQSAVPSNGPPSFGKQIGSPDEFFSAIDSELENGTPAAAGSGFGKAEAPMPQKTALEMILENAPWRLS